MTESTHSPTIDVHCHLSTPAASALTDPHARPEYEPYQYFMGQDSIDHNKVMFPTIADALSNADARIAHMDAMGVDIQGLATFVSQYCYWAPAKVAAESARLQNDHLAEACRDHPDRFAPFGATVPLQDVDLAIAEMHRVVDDLGCRSAARSTATISTNHGSVRSGRLSQPRESRSSCTRTATRRATASVTTS